MTIVFVQGRAEFIEKYDSMFSPINEFPGTSLGKKLSLDDLKVRFVSIDFAGQGASKEGCLPSHIDTYDTYVEELRDLFNVVRGLDDGKKPVFLLGHSMGGLVGVRFTQKYPALVDGLIMASPFWGYPDQPELPAAAVRGIADFYAAPKVGLSRLCALTPLATPQELGGIAQCAGGLLGPECQTCIFQPAACTDPTGGYLAAKFAELQTAPEGCSDFGFPCPAPGLVDDDAFCEYINFHPNSGPGPTLGWLSASFAAQEAFLSGPKIRVPMLILSNPNDGIVSGESHTCDKFSGSCRRVTFMTPAHEILTGSQRAGAVREIRSFLRPWVRGAR